MSMAKIQILALGVGLSTFFSPAALAQAASAPASAPATSAAASAAGAPAVTKIGVVNIQDAILATEEGKKEFDALQQKFTPKQAELKNLSDEIEKLKKDYQAQGDKLNDASPYMDASE